MNSIQMCLFPLDNGRLVNILNIEEVVPYSHCGENPDKYVIFYTGGGSRSISKAEYERLKQLYCPPTQNIL